MNKWYMCLFIMMEGKQVIHRLVVIKDLTACEIIIYLCKKLHSIMDKINTLIIIFDRHYVPDDSHFFLLYTQIHMHTYTRQSIHICFYLKLEFSFSKG